MRRLTDCGDGQHKPIRDSDSYGNDIFKCKECGNRVYSMSYGSVGDGYGGTIGGSGSYYHTAGTKSSDYQSGYSVDKPKKSFNQSTIMNYPSTMSNYSTDTYD